MDPHRTNLSRPGYVKLSPFKAITSRSPLISLIFPSPRDKIRAFEEERKARMAPQKQERLQPAEAREIIKNELRKRQTAL